MSVMRARDHAAGRRRGRTVYAAAAALFLAGLAACTGRAEDPYAGTPTIEGDTLLRFPSGARYAGGLRNELTYLGRIYDDVGGTFLVMAGIECRDCDGGLTVLIRSVADSGAEPVFPTPGWYAYPGRLVHYDDERPMLESRLFWGRCLPGRGPGLVQFATEFDSVGERSRHVVHLTEIRNGRLVDDSIAVSRPSIATVRPAVAAGACREVPARAQVGGL